MSRLIVAVSGGVDSVVLLHMLVRHRDHELIVAHFDHGIRHDSAFDARFVEGLAAWYGLAFKTRREELGASASEEIARQRRYDFLRSLSKKYHAMIVTAHHQDDVIETIAINLQRGTGWRGLAAMNSSDIVRPLKQQSKQSLYDYALKYQLEWIEDSSNHSSVYLRNRLRKKLHAAPPTTITALRELYKQQTKLRQKIETETSRLALTSPYSRYFFTHIDTQVAFELLRTIVSFAITYPQAARALHAIKVAKPGSVFEAGAGWKLRFSARNFIVETP